MRLISDVALAAITIWQEARGESWEGKVAVGEVIRHRMERKYSSDGTVAGTVAKAFQFSGWLPRDPNLIPSLKLDDRDPVVHECCLAWNKSATTNTTNGAVLYCNPKALSQLPAWANPEKQVAEIGNHVFYRD